eukprot:TRINITY_DN1772_c0_g1_i1.p1 TRINITY_DN1772_c0_g1~~TRINITY_DN1772_c0_g1_i1.p1  ORF type:complete len:530 (+),score=185.01 TRINITY_DN1772_c0_g1_i1:60-1649(+)
MTDTRPTFFLDGETLSIAQLLSLGDGAVQLRLSDEAWQRVKEGRQVVDDVVASGRVVYGINTGFGQFATTTIEPAKLQELQVNLIRSHAAGVGERLSICRVRRLFALRINVLAKGHSGVSVGTLQQLLDAWNASCLPMVPMKGTLGASGDLAPLSHLALGLLGEGIMWNPSTGDWAPASEVLSQHALRPLSLQAKEGLALINGTQFVTSLACEALDRALCLARAADVIAALSVEALRGTYRAFEPILHKARPQVGQMKTARRVRSLLHSDRYPSQIYESHRQCPAVQDAYSLRCVPQVHGVVWDTIEFVRGIIGIEINCATDNPMVFASTNDIISGGNFHAEYPGKSMDYLAIAVQELANISERRVERLVNPALSGHPAFLVAKGGLNSGFMIAHCTAAALTSENKTLCHPATCDTISTSAAKEDHVSMGGWASVKCLQLLTNVETVIGVELLCASQALSLLHLQGLHSTEPLEALHALVREGVPMYECDRYMTPDIEHATSLVRAGRVWETVAAFLPDEVAQEAGSLD